MASDQGGAPNIQDARDTLRQSVQQVRKNVLRTLVEELRQEVESIGQQRVNGHGKADTHTKADMYIKFGTGVIGR
jgi:hypothetical protein